MLEVGCAGNLEKCLGISFKTYSLGEKQIYIFKIKTQFRQTKKSRMCLD